MAHKYLIIEAFNKAGEELKKQGLKKPSQQKRAELLSDFVDEKEELSLNERSYRDYYTDALKKAGKVEKDISIKQFKIIKGLANYLGYTTYQEFSAAYTKKEKGKLPLMIYNLQKEGRVVFIGVIILLIGIGMWSFTFIEDPKWMAWQEDHYEEAAFDKKLFNEGRLKIYNQDMIDNFKKVEVNCQTTFFDEKGRPKIWYYKKSDGELEYFTKPGLHPVVGETLKKITYYMINEHVCP